MTQQSRDYLLTATSLASRASFTSIYKTKDEALKSARQLRKSGLVVLVTGSDGKPVDEIDGKSER